VVIPAGALGDPQSLNYLPSEAGEKKLDKELYRAYFSFTVFF
jgi:hypothetical protein